jgi:outer membrane receptor for ferrienterochelin and colicin
MLAAQLLFATVFTSSDAGPVTLDQALAFDEQHYAPNELNILSQRNIEQTPAKTVGQAVQQLPGVSVQHDTGEPRSVGTGPMEHL